MNAKLYFNIIPHEMIVHHDENSQIFNEIGNHVSTINNIMVNKISDASYSIIIDTKSFMKINFNNYINKVSELFRNNLPDDDIIINMVLWVNNLKDPKNNDTIEICNKMSSGLSFIKNYMVNKLKDVFTNISDGYSGIWDIATQKYYNTSELEDDNFDDEDYYDEDEDDEDDDSIDELESIMNSLNEDYYDEDDEEEINPISVFQSIIDQNKDKKSSKSSKKSKSYYGSSRSLRSSNNPKKIYNRHGIIVAKKDAIKKDEKIINEFLKDFIPGDSSWKKSLRHDLRKRWISVYAITKKELNGLEKEYKKKHKKTYSSKIDPDKAITLTKKILSTTNDFWNDPNK